MCHYKLVMHDQRHRNIFNSGGGGCAALKINAVAILADFELQHLYNVFTSKHSATYLMHRTIEFAEDIITLQTFLRVFIWLYECI